MVFLFYNSFMKNTLEKYTENVENIIECLGGRENIASVSNCMTRLRVVVRSDSSVEDQKLEHLPDVLGLVHDRPLSYEIVVGPGKCRKYADICREMDLLFFGSTSGENVPNKNTIKSSLKILGDIFVPLIPGVISAGLCAGFASLISQALPDYANNELWNLIYNILSLINISFMTYMTAWVGYRSAERFGATPIIGGMLGMITSLDGINKIAQIIGLYNNESPLSSILHSGKGGVLAVIFGVLLLAFVEKKIRSIVPENLDIVLTQLLTLIICIVPYVLVVMPFFGFISSAVAEAFGDVCMSANPIERILVGYVATAVFLPLVACGMHHGLVALYSIQLNELGYVTLYPSLAMAGAGQVGASIAIYIKAKRAGNKRLCAVIKGALPAGFLGIGEPLIYSVTLPLGKPFITAGLGAGFGGALVMAMEVASTTWGPSGIIGAFVMTGGPLGAFRSVAFYLLGLVVSYAASFIITFFTISENELSIETESGKKDYSSYKHVLHGEVVTFDKREDSGLEKGPDGSFSFSYTITDALGVHARPAGRIVTLAKTFNSQITICAGEKKASAASLSELLKLGAVCGTKLSVTAVGNDAEAAANAVKSLLEEIL